MTTPSAVPAHVASLAAAQGGIISTAQLEDLDEHLRRRLTRRWGSVAPGLHPTRSPDWHSALFAGLLRGGPDAVVGGLAAAHLHGLTPDPPAEATIWIPPRQANRGFTVAGTTVRYRRAPRTGTGAPVRTRLEQTLLDVAGACEQITTLAVFARALTERRTTPDRLLTALDARRRLPHREVLTRLCGIDGEGVESVLEWLYAELVERPHGLPPMRRQFRLGGSSRLDGLYEDQGLAVEVDGKRFHDAGQDLERDNDNIANHDVATLRYGWHHVTRAACRTARQVVAGLRLRGWDGVWRRCPKC